MLPSVIGGPGGLFLLSHGQQATPPQFRKEKTATTAAFLTSHGWFVIDESRLIGYIPKG